MGLGQEITKATGGRMKLDRSTENLLAFNASGTAPAAPAAGAQGCPAPATSRGGRFGRKFKISATALRRNCLVKSPGSMMAISPYLKTQASASTLELKAIKA